jgi:hypothetical protein
MVAAPTSVLSACARVRSFHDACGYLQPVNRRQRRGDSHFDVTLFGDDLVVEEDPNWKLEVLVRNPFNPEDGRTDKFTEPRFDFHTSQRRAFVCHLFLKGPAFTSEKLVFLARDSHEATGGASRRRKCFQNPNLGWS